MSGLTRYITFILFCFFVVMTSCNNDEKQKQEAFKQKVERDKEIQSNPCRKDSDCIITGCRGTLCRSMVEDEYCDHRLVMTLDDKRDLGVIERIVKQRLTVREAESVRLGGHSAGKWILSFQAPQAQRERIEHTIASLAMSGLAVLHPTAVEDSKKVYDAFHNHPDVFLRTMRGAGPLVEKQIRSGDLLSKDDIRDAWQSMAPILEKTFDVKNDIEHFWSYDVITGKIAYLRLWPVDKRTRISVKLWDSLNYHIENGDIHVEGQLSDKITDQLEKWTSEERLILLLLGNEVLASALPEDMITDGKFDIILRSASANEDLVDAMEILSSVAEMKGGVRLDPEATAHVERDIECHKKFPRQCGCTNNVCGWKTNVDYNGCLYE